MIYCCRFYNIHVNEPETIIFKLVPKNRYSCINIGIWIPEKYDWDPGIRARDHGFVSPSLKE
jgi:hypothetical protein